MAFLGVLPEAENQSFGTRLARGLGSGLGAGLSQSAQFAQQMGLERQKSHSLANQTKQLEKVKMMETGLGTIDRMRELISSTGPSNWIQGLLPGETQKNRSEFEALGRSLIPLVAAGVPIRNQKEFEEYRKVITNPNSQQSAIEGALAGIQSILERSSESPEKKEKEVKKTKKDEQKVKIKTPEGKVFLVPKSQVKEAMEAGGSVIR